MDIKKVGEALKTIAEALWDKDFRDFLEKNGDSLAFHYDAYKSGCLDEYEEPDSFEEWALNQYVCSNEALKT